MFLLAGYPVLRKADSPDSQQFLTNGVAGTLACCEMHFLSNWKIHTFEGCLSSMPLVFYRCGVKALEEQIIADESGISAQ